VLYERHHLKLQPLTVEKDNNIYSSIPKSKLPDITHQHSYSALGIMKLHKIVHTNVELHTFNTTNSVEFHSKFVVPTCLFLLSQCWYQRDIGLLRNIFLKEYPEAPITLKILKERRCKITKESKTDFNKHSNIHSIFSHEKCDYCFQS